MREGNTLHHISYFPEIKIRVCRKCHGFIHWNIEELCPPEGDYNMFIQTFDGSEEFGRYGICNDFAKILATIPKKRGVTTDTIIRQLSGDINHQTDYYRYLPYLYTLLRNNIVRRKEYKYNSKLLISSSYTHFLWYRNGRCKKCIVEECGEDMMKKELLNR